MAAGDLVALRGRGLLHRFLEPLCFGTDAVEIKAPLTSAAVDQLLSEATTRSPSIQGLEVGLQRLADQLVPHPVDIRVSEEDLLLVVAAYHVAFQLHHSVAEGRVWDRRLEDLNEQVWKILHRVAPARTEGQLLARHLMLRHLPVAYRVDTRVEFGAFWGPLVFRGQEASWVQWPLRTHHHIEKNSVWIGSQIEGRTGAIYARLLSLTPVTKLLHVPTLGPLFDWHGCVTALAAPGPCRLVTNTLLNDGLARAMPSLGNAFRAYCTQTGEPLAHRRYVGRFLLNLALTHVTFLPDELLDAAPDPKTAEPQPPPDLPPAAISGGGKTEAAARKLAQLRAGIASFYAVIGALHQLRGPLGAAHLYADDRLASRLETFLSALPDKTLRFETFQSVATGLQYPLL